MNTAMNEHKEWLGKQAVDIAYHLHKALGQGYLKKYMKHVSLMNCRKEIFLLSHKRKFQ